MKSVLVIGMGRFGRHLANKLQEMGNDVMIVDKSDELIDRLSANFTDSYIGDCTDDNVVSALGVDSFDICFVTIGEDFQSSLVITSLLKKRGARFVVAKANQDIQAEILKTIGADEVVYPEREIAEKLAVRYNSNNVFDFIRLTGDYSIFEIPIRQSWIDETIGDIRIRSKYNINVIAVKNERGLSVLPGADYRFCRDDHIVIIGKSSDVFKLTNSHASK